MTRRALLRAARANIAAARDTYLKGNTGLAYSLLACARDQVTRAKAAGIGERANIALQVRRVRERWLSMRVEP